MFSCCHAPGKATAIEVHSLGLFRVCSADFLCLTFTPPENKKIEPKQIPKKGSSTTTVDHLPLSRAVAGFLISVECNVAKKRPSSSETGRGCGGCFGRANNASTPGQPQNLRAFGIRSFAGDHPAYLEKNA